LRTFLPANLMKSMELFFIQVQSNLARRRECGVSGNGLQGPRGQPHVAGEIAAYCRPENKVSLGLFEGIYNKIHVIQRRPG
jgi:hypothetical protein